MSEKHGQAAARARAFIESLSEAEREEIQRREDEGHRVQHMYFRQGYRVEKCYLCGKDFRTISRDQPCLHWLLRRGKFKPKDINLIADKYGYHQVSAYLRWCANEERLVAHINDIPDEAAASKILSSTIKWKNVEWSFDCSANDLAGHEGKHTSFPHYHFQMRIDGKQFINFNDYHLPFNDQDLFAFQLNGQGGIHFDFGQHGMGMKNAMELDPQDIIDHTTISDSEDSAVFNMQTLVMAGAKPMRGEDVADAIEESRRSGRSIASILHERMADSDVSIQTVITPSPSVPEITPRTDRSRR